MRTHHWLLCSLLCAALLLDGCGGSDDDGSSSQAGTTVSSSIGAGGDNGDDKPAPIDEPSEENPDVPAPSQALGALIANVKISRAEDTTTAQSVVTFGQVFRRGAVGSDQRVTAAIKDEALPTQVDRKSTWSDGSLRNAVITVLPGHMNGGDEITIGLHTVSSGVVEASVAEHDGPTRLASLAASGFTADVTINSDGRQYKADALAAIQQIVSLGGCEAAGPRLCKPWLQGSIASEWIVSADLHDGSGSASRLGVYFNIRAYAGAGGMPGDVRVDTVIENDRAYHVTPGNVGYDATIQVGASSYQVKTLKHLKQARWHKVLWSRGDPGLYAQIDTEYLQSTRAISNYEDVTPSESFLASRPQAFTPMTNGNNTAHMGNTGAQATIGPLPRWTSTYVVSGGDRRAFGWMLANEDAVGSYAFHYRDGATGRPLTITDHPYVTIADYSHASRAGGGYLADLLPSCASDCASPYSFDISHHPSIGYVSYLVTGDYFYLEELQFAASYVELWANPNYRDYAAGKLDRAQGQVRGQAWALRTIADAAFATPDDDPLKSYFSTLIDNIFKDYNRIYTDKDDGSNPLHVLDGYGAVIYRLNGQSRVGIGPWQADFFTWSVGHAAELGVPGADRFLDWLASFQIGMMTGNRGAPDDGYCWIVASGYSLQIRDAQGSPMYGDLGAAYRATYPQLAGLSCASQVMANELSFSTRQFKIGEMSGYADSPTGFPSNLQIGLAMAVNSHHPDGARAWKIFANRSVKPAYGDYANFAVAPR